MSRTSVSVACSSWGLGLLLLINVLGYLAGVTALGTGDERAIFPYIRGRYTGVHVLAVFCLMLMFQLSKPGRRPVYFLLILIAYLMCVYFMIQINSRLSFMVFVVLTVLFMTRAIKVVRGLYTISLFTIPLLLSFSLLVYKVLTTPVFAAILQRVSKEDVTTFNGRSYIWTAIGDWALHDRTGLLFGNGYKGHYYLHLLDFVAVLWEEPHAYNLHSHSTFTEVLVGQGPGHRALVPPALEGIQSTTAHATWKAAWTRRCSRASCTCSSSGSWTSSATARTSATASCSACWRRCAWRRWGRHPSRNSFSRRPPS
ncbi:MAG: O-antigen ligase family protein [Flavobacteriales bacterium]|nr:O-antigen ligase family protein [Flavobacteriales bacterium]